MMRVTLFGTRGSLATPGVETSRYGGNTSAVEMRGDHGAMLVLDAGTGIRQLGSQIPPETSRIDVLLTHLHMDHIQGLGFFGPLYNPDIDIHIWGPASSTQSLAQRLSRYLSPPLFPIHLRDLPRVTCHHVPRPAFEIGPFRIGSCLVCHPGPTVGYRISDDSGTVVYLPDHEPALALRNGDWSRPEWISGYDLAVEADLLIHDSQYADEHYRHCIGWGHRTYTQASEFAAQVGARMFVPFHHDPSHTDETLDQLLASATQRMQSKCRVCAGVEGSIFEVGVGS